MEKENTTSDQQQQQQQKEEAIVQYIAMRNDLKWPKGALIAQGAHCSVAAIHLNYSDADTVRYLSDLDRMHKIVVAVPSQAELVELSAALERAGLKFKLWTEQPENIPVSLATKPYPKSHVDSFFRAFKLFK